VEHRLEGAAAPSLITMFCWFGGRLTAVGGAPPWRSGCFRDLVTMAASVSGGVSLEILMSWLFGPHQGVVVPRGVCCKNGRGEVDGRMGQK